MMPVSGVGVGAVIAWPLAVVAEPVFTGNASVAISE